MQRAGPDPDNTFGKMGSSVSNQSEAIEITKGSSGLRTTFLWCAALLLAGIAAVAVIFNTEPTPQRETAVRQTAMLVDVTQPEAGTFRPVIEAMGTVTPAREITLRPRVTGLITSISEDFTPGGFVGEGDTLVRIDEADYRNTLQQRQSELARAEADLEMEQGQQAKARQDYADLGRELPPERRALVLRQPQLRSAEAAVQSARAALEQARLDLQRTTVTAPFDAHVVSRAVNQGSQAASGDTLGRLVGIDTYWIEATVAVSKLRWLAFADGDPDRGSPVRIRIRTAWPEDTWREGYLFRLVGELDMTTRMARALIAIDDPLAREAEAGNVPPLMIGAFVEARIRGREITDAVRIRRDHLRKDDTVWIMRDGKLAIEPVEVILRDAEYAYIRSGLGAEDQVVTSSLATVKEGVALRTDEAGQAATDATGAQLP